MMLGANSYKVSGRTNRRDRGVNYSQIAKLVFMNGEMQRLTKAVPHLNDINVESVRYDTKIAFILNLVHKDN
jgi:hypothetical protein